MFMKVSFGLLHFQLLGNDSCFSHLGLCLIKSDVSFLTRLDVGFNFMKDPFGTYRLDRSFTVITHHVGPFPATAERRRLQRKVSKKSLLSLSAQQRTEEVNTLRRLTAHVL